MKYVAGETSTGSKRPGILYGGDTGDGIAPVRVIRSDGCHIWDPHQRTYLDWIMALGAVALGYGHPAVVDAAIEATRRGVVGPLPPVEEEELAALLVAAIPWVEQVRFLKTGAEAVAAAVRLARVTTGRDQVLGCGYHGWLDWCSEAEGVPTTTRSLFDTIPFNDAESAIRKIRALGDRLACVVVEPVVEGPPTREWLQVLRTETEAVGALLVVDEIKTAFRVAIGGGIERWGGGIRPDLVVLGKALANGFPLAVVGGSEQVMRGVDRTWISSTLATESVSLAAAIATVQTMTSQPVCDHLNSVGSVLLTGLRDLADRYPDLVSGAKGIPEMCFLSYRSNDVSRRVTLAMAERGILFKRSAYNFSSLAHGVEDAERTVAALEEVLTGCREGAC